MTLCRRRRVVGHEGVRDSMAKIHGGQIAARQLQRAGIDTLFGVVAGPMIELFAGGQLEGLRVIGCRHEINAGFMASAWGWQKQRPGVLVAGSGPAVTNCITPLYVATESAMPLVVLGGSAFSNTTGLGGFQELDQLSVARPVCKWTGRVDSTERIGEWLHLALGKALEGRPGGVYLDFPGEVVGQIVYSSTGHLIFGRSSGRAERSRSSRSTSTSAPSSMQGAIGSALRPD